MWRLFPHSSKGMFLSLMLSPQWIVEYGENVSVFENTFNELNVFLCSCLYRFQAELPTDTKTKTKKFSLGEEKDF